MSYSRSYRTSIKIRERISVDYPASQNGGTQTITYEHVEPINIDVNVDTEPFDYSIVECDKQVDALNGAVISMKSAQVLSIHEVSYDIAKHVTDGFFNMVSSEISQQIADLLNKVNSKMILMIEQKKAAANILEIMQRDYHRLSSHYQDIFENLDTELKRRIHTLDNQSFKLAEEVVDKLIMENTLNAGSSTIIESSDISNLQTILISSVLKNKVNALIDSLRQYLIEEKKLSESLKDIVEDRKIDQVINIYLPLLIFEKTQIPNAENQFGVVVCDDIPEAIESEISKELPEYYSTLHWSNIKQEDRDRILLEYQDMINSEFSDKVGEEYTRQRELMMKFIQGNLQTIN